MAKPRWRQLLSRVAEGLFGPAEYAPTYDVVGEAELRARIQQLEKAVAEAWGDEIDPYEYLTDTPGFARTGLALVHNEQELRDIRALARLLTTSDPMSVGIVEKLTNYVIRTGYTYTVEAEEDANPPAGLVQAVDRVLDEFRDLNDWDNDLDREIFRVAHEDGDLAVALYADEWGQTLVRTIDADQIQSPSEQPPCDRDWSYGVDTAANDVQRVFGYWVAWEDKLEWMPAAQIEHIRLNVRRTYKRGLSDFYPVYKKLTDCAKLDRNMTMGAAIQAAIAYIKKLPPGTSHSGASSIQSLNATNTETRRYHTGDRTVYTQKFDPGTILTVVGTDYIHGPMGQSNAPTYLSVLQNGWRLVAARWSMPEHVATSDASNNNYASILEAGAPFVLYCEQQQRLFSKRFLRIIWKAVWNAYCAGRFAAFRVSWQDLLNLINIEAVPPDVSHRDRKAETDRRAVLLDKRVISLRQFRQEEGYDPDEMAREVEQDPLSTPPAAPPFTPAGPRPAPESHEERLKLARDLLFENYP